jgi:hypothetical protein
MSAKIKMDIEDLPLHLIQNRSIISLLDEQLRHAGIQSTPVMFKIYFKAVKLVCKEPFSGKRIKLKLSGMAD